MRPEVAFYKYAFSDCCETANVLQFLRMLPVKMNARVVQVEYIDNGDLNVQYCEKKKALMKRGGDYKEFFVFHGTNGKQDMSVVAHLYIRIVHTLRARYDSNYPFIHPGQSSTHPPTHPSVHPIH